MSDAQVHLSPTEAVVEINRFGSTVLRDAWSVDHLITLREALASFFEMRGQRVANGTAKPSEKMLHQHGGGVFGSVVAEGISDLSILRNLFEGSFYHQMSVEYLKDDEIYVDPVRLAFRNHDPATSKRTFVPYHQDSGSQDRRVGKVLNCWIPLDPGCGLDAPGLEVVRSPSEPNFPIKDMGLLSENALYDFITIDRDSVLLRYGEDQFLAPVFNVGDGFAFSQDVIHRTYVTPEMTKPRLNFEFRVFSLRNLAPDVAADMRQSLYRVA